ncbi:protein of unknown function [Cupriavidus taiwanensis]|uniref:Uncharacterized protein n=1 Tax=Cupriavidus taiwanensis TaxID=164546 RepID=A0A375IF06_9BURK|nr:protein of unknown function [Cupriavidus taiwanensis]
MNRDSDLGTEVATAAAASATDIPLTMLSESNEITSMRDHMEHVPAEVAAAEGNQPPLGTGTSSAPAARQSKSPTRDPLGPAGGAPLSR